MTVRAKAINEFLAEIPGCASYKNEHIEVVIGGIKDAVSVLTLSQVSQLIPMSSGLGNSVRDYLTPANLKRLITNTYAVISGTSGQGSCL